MQDVADFNGTPKTTGGFQKPWFGGSLCSCGLSGPCSKEVCVLFKPELGVAGLAVLLAASGDVHVPKELGDPLQKHNEPTLYPSSCLTQYTSTCRITASSGMNYILHITTNPDDSS